MFAEDSVSFLLLFSSEIVKFFLLHISSSARLELVFTPPSPFPRNPLFDPRLLPLCRLQFQTYFEHLFSLLTQSFFIWFKWHGFLMLASCRRVFFCVHVSKWNCHTHIINEPNGWKCASSTAQNESLFCFYFIVSARSLIAAATKYAICIIVIQQAFEWLKWWTVAQRATKWSCTQNQLQFNERVREMSDVCVCACVFHCHLFLTYEQWMAVLLVTCGKITEQMKQENGNGRETDYDRDMAAVSYTFLQCSVIISSWNWCGAFAHHCHKASVQGNSHRERTNDKVQKMMAMGLVRGGGEAVEEKRWRRRDGGEEARGSDELRNA